jgi:hypothetical protein
MPWDERAGVRKLPVIRAERRARIVTEALMIGFDVTVIACAALGALPRPAPRSLASAPPGSIHAGAALTVRRCIVRANIVVKMSAPRMFRNSL